MKRLLSVIISLAIMLSMNMIGWAQSQEPEVTVYTENEFLTIMQSNQGVTNLGKVVKGSIVPDVTVIYEFDHYTAKHNATSDFQYFMGEFTVYNNGSTPCTASYCQQTYASFSASFTSAVSANTAYKGAVIEVGTSASVGGTLQSTISTSFTYNTGATVPGHSKVTITMYQKGVGVLGCKVYAMYDIDRITFLGYDYRYDTSNCNFPKFNSYTAVVSEPVGI